MKEWTNEFFDLHESVQNMKLTDNNNDVAEAAAQVYEAKINDPEQFKYSEFMKFMENVSGQSGKIENHEVIDGAWANEFSAKSSTDALPDWVKEFGDSKEEQSNFCCFFFYIDFINKIDFF